MQLVLVVDSNRQVCSHVARALESVGCAVVAAHDGQEAMRTLAALPVDGLVIELILPGLDAFKTIIEVRRRWPRCRVVAMSGGGSLLTPVEALDVARVLGAHASLSKPFSSAQLLAAMAGDAPTALRAAL